MATSDESWFYCKQISRKSLTAAWVAKGDPPPTIIRRHKFVPKALFSIFFKSNDPLLIHQVKREPIIDHRYYIGSCLQPRLDETRHQRPSYGTNRIILHQNNRRLHLHEHVPEYLESEGIRTVPHPSNSPGLSLCDFWLFDLTKRNLSDHNNAQSLHHAINELFDQNSSCIVLGCPESSCNSYTIKAWINNYRIY